MFQANFNNFIWLHHFYQESATFLMLFPYFNQISQNNQPFWINFNSFQLYVCVCLRHLRMFQDDCSCSEAHTIISLLSCTAFNPTAVMMPRRVQYFWQVSSFLVFTNYLAQTRKTKQIALQKFLLALGV